MKTTYSKSSFSQQKDTSKLVAGLTNDITKLASHSKVITTPKAVIDDMIQVSFNMLFNQIFCKAARPYGTSLLYKNDFYTELTKYKKDLKAWNKLGDLASNYLELVHSLPYATDVLTEIISPFANITNLAQYLSPPDVADFVIELGMGEFFSENIKDKKVFKYGDPCGCGTGSLILAAMRNVYENHGKEGVQLLDIYGIDIDPLMCKASILQIEMASIIHKVEHNQFRMFYGNALLENQEILYRSIPNGLRVKSLDIASILDDRENVKSLNNMEEQEKYQMENA